MTPPRGLVVITGGGRGIGAAVVREAAASGWAVLLGYAKDEEAAVAVAYDVRCAGGWALSVRADVAEEADVLALFSAADASGLTLAGLVNNAGITGGLSRVADLTRVALDAVLAVNVSGSFLCAREAVRRMSTARGGAGGCIVNISSRAAHTGGSGEWVHYAATKGAIDTMTVGLAREVASEGIRVNAVAPGLVETDIHRAAGVPDRARRMAPSIPMGRAGTAEEVARAVVWLLSPAASYVTGAVLPVGGGR